MLRRKAAAKFDDPADWLFTDEALQQATAEPVAAHRARRLAGATVHDATCSIGTELAALRNSAASVVGSDVDPVRLAMARHNVADVDLAAPTRCDPSPETPLSCSTPRAAAADVAASIHGTTRLHSTRCSTYTAIETSP